MKFGKRLNKQIKDTLPEWRDKFLSYKDLKKLVRLISVVPAPGLDSKGEAEFIHLLHAEIEKFNSFFVEQEEDFIIRQKELKDTIQDVIDTVGPTGSRPSEAEYRVEMGKIRRDIVNFHGEMVLLENYSSINYTGLAKILKKYDKRTGHLLRLPFIESVLQQPFFTTDLISKLVKECETTMAVVFPNTNEEPKDVNDDDDDDPAEENGQETTVATEQGIFRSTLVALATMRELRGGSSTYSHFSLPPLVLPDADLLQFLQPSSPIPIQ